MWFVGLATGCLPGCATLQLDSWELPPHAPVALCDISEVGSCPETWYAEAVRLEAEGSAAAVDAYLQSALAAWPAVERIIDDMQAPSLIGGSESDATGHDSQAWKLYHSAVAGLLVSAQKFGRWSPTTGLLVMGPRGLTPLETTYHGFVWAPTEFGEIHPVGDDPPAPPARSFRREGLGVPLVVVRNDAGVQRPFLQPNRPFAATAVVRPVHTATGAAVRLEFFDPLRQSQLQLVGREIPLASDISAPTMVAGGNSRQAWLEPFLRPAGAGGDDRLEMLEPYQPGKIPVLFIHGLLSDPRVWVNMVNEIQAQSPLSSRYQIWTFRYDTGEPFLASAAALRRQLTELQALYNPSGADLTASNIVIVGHSMGGLIAKLQVTYSGTSLWNAVASVPPEQIRTDPATRAALEDAFFFDPSYHVGRVIYIGTPHLGSSWAVRTAGRLGSTLVEPSPLAESRQAQLIRDNPNVFSDEISQRFPTSVDLLEPTSPLLNATTRLPYRRNVALHSIIGERHSPLGSDPSDGIVPVSSARLPGVASEKVVDCRHMQLPHNEVVAAEVIRLLVEHAQAIDVSMPVSTSNQWRPNSIYRGDCSDELFSQATRTPTEAAVD